MASAMRYRLRTLMIAAAVGPPMLALAWFGAIWAWHALPSVINDFGYYLLLAGVLGALVLVVYSAVAPTPGSREPATPRLCLIAMLSACEFLALWQWIWACIAIGGWLFIWGDLGPPVSERVLTSLAAIIAATINYVRTVAWLTGVLLSIAALFWTTYLLR
jgi:hypothetical protein